MRSKVLRQCGSVHISPVNNKSSNDGVTLKRSIGNEQRGTWSKETWFKEGDLRNFIMALLLGKGTLGSMERSWSCEKWNIFTAP